jgi:UDP-N-acetylglucosamine acyltransferase
MRSNNDRYPFNDIHYTAIIYPGVVIGRGNVIGPYCIIGAPPEWKNKEHYSGQVVIGHNNIITGLVTIDSGAESGNTKIANSCYIMKAVHIGHNAVIGSRVTISCHAIIGGHTDVGNDANIGLGAIIHQKQLIAEGVMIGMGAIVTKKLRTLPFYTYVGNPAKLLGVNDKHPNYETYTINLKDTL